MTESPVTYEARDGVGWITLIRPAVLNALTTELAIAEHMITSPVQDYSRFSLMHTPSPALLGHALYDL